MLYYSQYEASACMRVCLFVCMYVAARQYFHCPPGNTGIRFEVIFISFLYAICMLE